MNSVCDIDVLMSLRLCGNLKQYEEIESLSLFCYAFLSLSFSHGLLFNFGISYSLHHSYQTLRTSMLHVVLMV